MLFCSSVFIPLNNSRGNHLIILWNVFAGCENPHPIDFGTPLIPLTNTVGSILAYQCMPGYEPVSGNPEVVCLGTGQWSLPKFQCVIGKLRFQYVLISY